MNHHSYQQLWEQTRILSQFYWAHYERLIGSTGFLNKAPSQTEQEAESEDSDVIYDSSLDLNDPIDWEDVGIDDDEEDLESEESDELYEDEDVNPDEVDPEYLEFIKITRKHQAERERLKKLESSKKLDGDFEEYYKDISQVNTLVEDNITEAPDRSDVPSAQNQPQQDLVRLYGGRENYDRIRSMEMNIDENFSNKCRELSPSYWPVMPLNPKPYLNPLRN